MPPVDEQLESKDEELEVEGENPVDANEPEVEVDENSDEVAAEEAEDESQEESDDSEESEFERRFSQFKGDTLEEYVKNLEEGYANSSTEAVRLNRELRRLRDDKMSAIANSEKEGDEKKPAEDPALVYARQKMEEDAAKDYRTFAELHPEIDELSDQFDESLFNEFDKEAGYARDYLYRTTGKIPTLMEAMRRAWAVMNPDSNVSKEEKVAMNAKNTAAGTKSKSIAKEKPKPKFSDAQIDAAVKMDPKLEGKSRAEVEEILSKYVK